MKKDMFKSKKLNIVIAVAVGLIVVVGAIFGVLQTKVLRPQNLLNSEHSAAIIVEEKEAQNMLIAKKTVPASSFVSGETSGSAVQVTATITPDRMNSQQVEWSMAWASSDNTWASGKTPAGYILLETSTDTKTVTVHCVEPFSCQILLTATAKSNSAAKATCTIDYASRIESFFFSIGGVDFTELEEIQEGTYLKTLVYDLNPDKDYYEGMAYYNLGWSEAYSLKMSETVTVSCEVNDVSFQSSYFDDIAINGPNYHLGWSGDLQALTLHTGEKVSEMTEEQAYEKLNAYEGQLLYTFTVMVKTDFETKTFYFQIEFGGLIDTTPASAVNVAPESVVL